MSSSSLIPPVPQKTQALATSTFVVPPLDASITISEIFDWHIDHSPHHPACIYTRADGSKCTLSWREMVQAMYRGSKTIRDRMHWTSESGSCVIGILSLSENIAYFTSLMCVIRAGYCVFAISPRNSAIAVASLLKQAGVKHLLVGREQVTADLANDALKHLEDNFVPSMSPMLIYDDLFSGPSVSRHDVPYFRKPLEEIVAYVHSSGSTAFPKLIPWTNRHMIELCLGPWFGEIDFTGSVFALHGPPMFHSMGIFITIVAASTGAVFSVFEPTSPPMIPTPQSLIKAAQDDHCDYIIFPPSILEASLAIREFVLTLFSRALGIQNMSNGYLAAKIYGGGPLGRPVGNFLVSKGVNIIAAYGSNETGFVAVFTPQDTSEWEYIVLSPQQGVKMIPYGDNTSELVLVATDFWTPCTPNTKVNGKDAYATSDILESHPELPGLWRIFGRADDQIMHSTGEKTNPGPLENLINEDLHVTSSVMFGRQRFNAGVIVELKPEYRLDAYDETQLAEWRNKIWPSIERANSYAPQHSRIFKEMIMFSNASKPFSYTAKHNPRRHAIIDEYAHEIDKLYAAVEESTQSDIPSPSHWSVDGVKSFVRAVIGKIMIQKIEDDDDLFQNGCDSLQATWIRNTILRALRDHAHVNVREVSESFVYSHPTITSLSCSVVDLVVSNGGGSISSQEKVSNKVRAMTEMVEKYVQDLPVHTGTLQSDGEVVLLTGSTGGFGCHILAKLVENETIRRVYAINRPSNSSDLRERQRRALLDQGLNSAIVDQSKVVLVGADLNAPCFGLDENVYHQMHRGVTHIIHNAWPVNFNLSLSSFEPNIKSLRQLINFSLTSPLAKPPKVLFTSSIGVLFAPEDSEPIPEHLVAPQVAVSTGYAESKWASEQILSDVASKTPLEGVVVRVGQLCGGENGCWNIKEWLPSIIQAAPVLGCLPFDDRDISWIPSDVAASAMVDFVFGRVEHQVLHLVHPRTVPWSPLASILAQKLSVQLVPLSEWVNKLEILAGDIKPHHSHLSALQLLPSYRGMAIAKSGNAFGMYNLDTRYARASSAQTLASEHLQPIGEDQVATWVEYWKSKGTLVLKHD